MSCSLGAFIQKKDNTLGILKSPRVWDITNVIFFPFPLSDSVGSHPMRKVWICSFQGRRETTKAHRSENWKLTQGILITLRVEVSAGLQLAFPLKDEYIDYIGIMFKSVAIC